MYNGSEEMTAGTYMVPVASSNQQMGLTATFPETGPAGSDETPKFIVDQGFYAADPNYYGYYCTGSESPGESDDRQWFFGLDGQDLHGSEMHTDFFPYVYYTPSYGYTPSPYNPYNPFIPGAFEGAGGPVLGAQQYLPSSGYQQTVSSPAYFPVLVYSGAEIAANFAPESFAFSPVSAGSVEPDTLGGRFTQTASLVTPTKQQSDSAALGSVPLSPPVPGQVLPSEVSQFVAARVKQPVVNGAGASVGLTQARDFADSVKNSERLKPAPFVPSSPKLSISTYNCSRKFEPNIRGQSTVNGLKPRSQFSGAVNTINGSVDILGDQTCGPRTGSSRANKQGNIAINVDQFNREDFPVDYSAAKFFVIKSYSEDDVHKSIKYGVWSSTPNGNKRLDSAYGDAQRLSKGDGRKCPVFLFFSVNASGQFCGVAEMTGHVDFCRDMDFWQQDKWTGSFPAKWHIVKDVPNSSFRHIILENNEHKPVTNSRDTQEVSAVDVDRAELFCCVCRDQVYDTDFDAAVVLAQKRLSIFSPSAAAPSPPAVTPPSKRRKVVRYRPWAPDPREKALVGLGSSPLPPPAASSSSSPSPPPPWGLRGLNNLGNTCFMNSVLQALLHAPPLRNYFLSDRHNRFLCQQRRLKKGNAMAMGGGLVNGAYHRNAAAGLCLACDLDAMYSAVFSGDRVPYSPVRFLHSWWQHATNLASYEQQDAHEFFISMLDGLHEKLSQGQCKPAASQGAGECCIAHRVFSGILRSDVICTVCGFTSTTYDPCVDISLDLDSGPGTAKALGGGGGSAANGGGALPGRATGISTLSGCLDRFTRPERLGSEQKFLCQHCQVRQESLKQMSIRKLPFVTCFHIKRFEHSSTKRTSRKVDRYLQFPLSLNMAPYLSSAILRGRFGSRIFAFEGEELEAAGAEAAAADFELFAVVTHSGKLNAGHYVTYLRLSDQWYKCDDAWITRVTENIVRAAQAYMLFYVQKMLFYKASKSPAAAAAATS